MVMFVIITRAMNDSVKHKLNQLLNAGIDAYVIVDQGLEKSTKRFITYDNSELADAGFKYTHVTASKNRKIHEVTGWDKALYHAYKTGSKYTWICEDDMFWNRPAVINMILKATEKLNDDLIAYPISNSYQDNPNWVHWHYSERLTKNKNKWGATYNQLCRVSHDLVNKIHSVAKQKNELVLHEALLATVSKMFNLKISYYNDLNLPIYITIHWKKTLSNEEIEKLLEENSYVLIHPVKGLA